MSAEYCKLDLAAGEKIYETLDPLSPVRRGEICCVLYNTSLFPETPAQKLLLVRTNC